MGISSQGSQVVREGSETTWCDTSCHVIHDLAPDTGNSDDIVRTAEKNNLQK